MSVPDALDSCGAEGIVSKGCALSLGIVLKSPAGVVLGADSRVTLTAENRTSGERTAVYFDNVQKLLRFKPPHTNVGVVTYGMAAIGSETRSAHSYIPQFEAALEGDDALPVEEFATRLEEFFISRWEPYAEGYSGQSMRFLVGGYDPGEPYGRLYEFRVPGAAGPWAWSGEARPK